MCDWATDASGLLDGHGLARGEQAFDVVLGGMADAFDLSQGEPRVVARYDTAPLVRPETSTRSGRTTITMSINAKSLGKLLLLARRLCERGCGFVTVTTNFVWDMHADVNNAARRGGHALHGPAARPRAVGVHRGPGSARADERILLVVCGEMGRTPRINANGGRDHWGNLAPLLVSGGGLQMGQVIGQSTRDAGEPLSEPVRIKNLLGTILHTLLDTGEVRVTRGVPGDINRLLTEAEPIAGLVS